MSIQTKRVPIVTNGSGVAAATVRGACILHAVELTLGTLSTPDIAITDDPSGFSILSVAGVAADTRWATTTTGKDAAGSSVVGSAVGVPVLSRLQIDISGAGATKTGELLLLYER